MLYNPIPQEERDRLRKNLERSTPTREVALSAQDSLQLLTAYEDALREIDRLNERVELLKGEL